MRKIAGGAGMLLLIICLAVGLTPVKGCGHLISARGISPGGSEARLCLDCGR